MTVRFLLRSLLVALSVATSVTALRAEEALVTFRVLSPEIALKAASAALAKCRADG